eukprot:Rmarinus@m.26158
MEHPRLSGMLRTFMLDRPFEYERASNMRDSLLKGIKRGDVTGVKGKNANSLYNDIFGSIPKTPAIQDALKEYSTVITAVCGDSCSPEERASAAINVFHTLFPAYEDAPEKLEETKYLQQRLQKVIGVIEPAVLRRLCACLTPLFVFKHDHQAEAPPSEGVDPNTALMAHGFGSEWYDELLGASEGIFRAGAVSEDDVPCEPTRPQSIPQPTASKSPTPLRRKSALDILRADCEAIVSAGGAGAAFESAEMMCSAVLGILQSEKTDDAIQMELLELLGFEAIEAVGRTLQARNQIVMDATIAAAADETDLAGGSARVVDDSELLGGKEDERTKRGAIMMDKLASVHVSSQKDKMLEKQLRKEEKRRAKERKRVEKAEAFGGDGSRCENERREDMLRRSGVDLELAQARYRQVEEEKARAVADPVAALEEAVMRLGGPTGLSDKNAIGGKKVILPEGTERKSTTIYEQISVPPKKTAPPMEGERRVPISELPEWAREGFAGCKTLNRIQSIVFNTAFYTGENMLVAAPTGAGKTNVALLTVLREAGQNFRALKYGKADFKVVYVAPMKALAQEVVEKFQSRLSYLSIKVRECTGDMQLSKKELAETHVIVTTPEKWDVITRKSGDSSLATQVRLLIIDEVHLLHDERGSVIEALVARTLRQVESSQSMIRIVGLSATLPNYRDVADFMRVSPDKGLFQFDNSFRPIPLEQVFIGVKAKNPMQRVLHMNEVCYEKAVERLEAGYQVMVFVHSRKDTVRTAEFLLEQAEQNGKADLFVSQPGDKENGDDEIATTRFANLTKESQKCRSANLAKILRKGIGAHHAGLPRSDRNLVEKAFSAGSLRVIVCTATLAWGVNLPAHSVIIRGTQLYDAKKGAFVDISMLDVLQIFGRAGRPQFDTSGEGIIITSHDKLPHFLGLLTQLLPIESNFIESLSDNLNAEVALGTVANVNDACLWLSYTFLFVRMRRNPLVYGIKYEELLDDPHLGKRRLKLITEAARKLAKCRMLRFQETTGTLQSVDMGRIASNFYIRSDTIEEFNEHLDSAMLPDEVLGVLSKSHEFENITVRDDELPELDTIAHNDCPYAIKSGVENKEGKVNALLQAYVSGSPINGFALLSDSLYVAQNAGRIARGLFEIAMRKNWVALAETTLQLCKEVDRRLWSSSHPLRQFSTISPEIIHKLERIGEPMKLDRIRDMTVGELTGMLRNPGQAERVKRHAHQIPLLALEAVVHPITRTVIRIELDITPEFHWNDRMSGGVEPFWIWIEDSESEFIYHSEYFLLKKADTHPKPVTQTLKFTVPISDPCAPQYYIRAISDRWLGSDVTHTVSLENLMLPEKHAPNTKLLDLQPLPTSALHNASYESLYKFPFFNPVQTQVFHTCYHSDDNVLMGAPTGSGKTCVGEMCMMRLFNAHPEKKVVYIAPMKAIVRERMKDWRHRFTGVLPKRLVELTGDASPDYRSLATADVILTVPEKWDGISRSWRDRSYVRKVGLVIIDEIHLLGGDRGPILEVIVSRMRTIAAHSDFQVRLVGLSTALANAQDLADWMGVPERGLFNFSPQVRPVQLKIHVDGFSGKHYCPRMAKMNKPTFDRVMGHSPTKPVIVFVSSRRQTRLTALDLISFVAATENPQQFVHADPDIIDHAIEKCRDATLKHTLSFGIGLHHAGLCDKDKDIVEDLFAKSFIQILVSTSTLAWGVNLPAHLVVVKGTEFFDPKTCRYVDFPVTDVLQMIGRAGRPQFDNEGIACILAEESKKNFYKKFLHEPFPVESSLPGLLHNHLNAEIAAGTLHTKQDAVDYLTWTYLFRRLLRNPVYYGMENTELDTVNRYLSDLIERTLGDLAEANCVEFVEETAAAFEDSHSLVRIEPLPLGRIASYYYLDYRTMRLLDETLQPHLSLWETLDVLTQCTEFDDLPVRHNEDQHNADLAMDVPLEVDSRMYHSPHTKAHLLLQAHFDHCPLPVVDYITDTKNVLDQSIRILQAFVDITADHGWLDAALNAMFLSQMVVQGRWLADSSLLTLPHFTSQCVARMEEEGIHCLPQLLATDRQRVVGILRSLDFHRGQVDDVIRGLESLPIISMDGSLPKTDFVVDEESEITVHLTRHTKVPKRVYAPRFAKPKQEGWWIVVGDFETGELLALKRINLAEQMTTKLTLLAPEDPGQYTLSLCLISDSYIGLDLQNEYEIRVREGDIVLATENPEEAL